MTTKKQQIAETAEDLFRQHGIKRVTVEEISLKAGLSKMTFYKYFQNKKELVKYLWQSIIDAGLEKLDEIDRSDIPFAEKIQALLKMKEDSVSQMGKQYVHDYLEYVPDVQRFYEQLLSKTMTKFMDFIRHAQEKGDVRKSMRPEFFIAALHKLTELANNDQLAALYPNYTDFVLEVNNFIYYGIMPVPEAEQK
ncbi:MAG: hypothetical protein COT43_04085 [Candidatus Marinimicrobia bacterium CG08_land_8_20_14_0_20_45_22]|nr:MAG: hypothetical protein COT43_04085 [Candidatus Marinimicrobia bacterium CG08_land_8_20_14_0_20_45_22]